MTHPLGIIFLSESNTEVVFRLQLNSSIDDGYHQFNTLNCTCHKLGLWRPWQQRGIDGRPGPPCGMPERRRFPVKYGWTSALADGAGEVARAPWRRRCGPPFGACSNNSPCYSSAMKTAFVRACLWLLIAVLPLQAVAAVTRACCQPVAAPGSVHGAGASADAHHHAPAVVAQQHHHDGAGVDYSDSRHAHGKSPADCCSGAGAPPAALRWTAPRAAGAHFLPPAALSTGYIPGGLERPPRRLPA